MQPLLELRQVHKTYWKGTDREVHALRNISLQVEKGEFLTIIGQSGSGKSTLMNCIGLLDIPTEGQYFLEGQDVSRLKARVLTKLRNRTIGFIFQGFNLLPELTALENAALPLLYRGVSLAERQKRAGAALEAVGLGKRMEHRPNQLSGGQQQRVAIARVLAADPMILLADEPTGNLDSASGKEITRLLCDLHQMGRTVILITHDPQIATIAPRTIRLQDGQIVSDRRRE